MKSGKPNMKSGKCTMKNAKSSIKSTTVIYLIFNIELTLSIKIKYF